MLRSKLTNIINDINSVLVPTVCFGCNAHLIRGEQHICTVCRNHLPLTEYTFNDENAVDRIFYGRISIKKASSFLFFYENGIVQQIIHHLKYKKQEQIGAFLGDWYGQILKKNNHLTFIDMVIPVPLHRKKLKKRGYNQVALFAKIIAHHINAEYASTILVKSTNTQTQTKKSRISRLQHHKELYALSNDSLLENKNILLVDDIITSGATIEICAKTILKAKGVKVYLTSMAVVPQFQ